MVDGTPRTEPAESILERLRKPLYLPAADELERAFSFTSSPSSSEDITDFCIFLFEQFDGAIYEYPTKEYIHGLSRYIGERVSEIGKNRDDPVTILEVGAGTGRLSHFLTQKLEEQTPGKTRTIAVDNFSWPGMGFMRENKMGTNVIDMPYEDALGKFKPDIVIGAWLPSGQKSGRDDDWSINFRKMPSVKNISLLGIHRGMVSQKHLD